MLYDGQTLKPHVAELFLPRGTKVIRIAARAVVSYDEFNQLVPVPKPGEKIVRGQGRQPDFDSPMYKQELLDYGRFKQHWMVLDSLRATPEITWETIKFDEPSTWGNYEKELEQAGFSEIERQRIINLVMEANGLDDRKLEEARELFLTDPDKHRLAGSTSQKDGQLSTPNGEQPKESESARQG